MASVTTSVSRSVSHPVIAGLIDLLDVIGTDTKAPVTSILTLTVKGKPKEGDRLIATIRTRGDRSFTIPETWTTLVSTSVGSGAASSNSWLYILTKPWESETEVSFTHSAEAACSGVLTVARGKVRSVAGKAGNNANIELDSSVTLMLAVGTTHDADLAAEPVWDAPFTDYATVDYQDTRRDYGISMAKAKGGLGNQVASYTWPGNNSPNYTYIIELAENGATLPLTKPVALQGSFAPDP
jgi:hypothetical protein